MHIEIRQASFSDIDGIIMLMKEYDLGLNITESILDQKWTEYWVNNPLLCSGESVISLGLVMLNGEEMVGFFGSIPRLYRYANEDIVVSVSSTWVVKKEFREYTKLITEEYFTQESIDLYLCNTAIKPVAKIYSKFSGQNMPQSDFGTVLFMILRPGKFLYSFLLKKNLNKHLAKFLSAVSYPLIAGLIKAKSNTVQITPEISTSISIQDISDIGSEFDELWERKTTGKPLLYAYRNSKYLRWSLGIFKRSHDVVMLCFRAENELKGFLVFSIEEIQKLNLRRARVIDIFVEDDNKAIISGLLNRAIEISEEKNCSVLEFVGFPEGIRACFSELNPFSRQYPSFPFQYLAREKALKDILEDKNNWYPTLFDGDASL
jgi:hypothetical protein